jgi:hypothetical protein
VLTCADVCGDACAHARSQGLRRPQPHVPPEADDLATLAYDMSTQGKIKGVMLSHRNLLSSSRALVYQALPPASLAVPPGAVDTFSLTVCRDVSCRVILCRVRVPSCVCRVRTPTGKVEADAHMRGCTHLLHSPPHAHRALRAGSPLLRRRLPGLLPRGAPLNLVTLFLSFLAPSAAC